MGSAADINEGVGGSGGVKEPLGSLGSARAHQVAAEIPVNATGTRAGSGPDKRELFSEETETVLVFPDGAVIQLSAAVATGQLIFLTNKRTNMEVVSQVVSKRNYRPTCCYVELKFTEEITGFWGVEFQKQEEAPVKVWTAAVVNEEAHQEAVTEEVQSSEPIEEHGTPAAVEPTGAEVQELREQVETLRRQLEEMKKAEEAAKLVASKAEPAKEVKSPFVPMQMPTAATPHVVSEVPVVAMPAIEVRSSHVAMKLPSRPPVKIDPEQEVIDQLLPQPELDFSKAPKLERDPADPYSIYKPTRAKLGKWVLLLVAFGLAGAVGLGVWRLGFVDRLLASRAKASAVQVEHVAAAKAPEISPMAVKPNAGAEPGATLGTTGAATHAPATEAVKDAAPTELPKAESGNPAVEKPKADNREAAAEARELAVKKKGVGPVESGKRGNAATKKKAPVSEPSAAVAPVEAASAVEEGPQMPAILLKSVSPEYPPDAMRNFITGDVTMKAEVDEQGKIRNMEVVSGPAALREAAIEAFKRYEYAPATRGGKGVASRVKVTIKFWFNP